MNRNALTALWITLAVGVVLAAVLFLLYGPNGSLLPSARPGERATVGLFAIGPERTIGDDFSSLASRLRQDFDVRLVEAESLAAIGDLDVLVVVGSGHLPDARLYEVDQFIMRGGRAAFLLDGASISADGKEATAVRGNLFAFAEAYGATANSDLVVDVASGSAAYESATGAYAFWPVGVPQEDRVAREIMPRRETVVFAWTSSLSIRDRVQDMAAVLARSGADTWTTLAFTSVAPDFEPEPDRAAHLGAPTPRGNYPLAVAIRGEFGSAFSGLPVIVEREDGTVDFTQPSDRIDKSVATRVAVVGSSRMFDDQVVEAVPANLDLMENLVTWLSDRRGEQ